MSNDRIAVTVIGGYLGSGKTTLVNHILREAAREQENPERIAVVVNDFGDINIDAELIEADDGDVLSLANGCICCSMVEGFAATLDTIIAMDPRPDRLVIEASGVSDPAQVAAYGHGPGLMMDAVIVLADAETIGERVEDAYVGQTVSQQLASANIVVLNKADLVTAEKLAETSAWLTDRCPDAFVTAVVNSRVPVELLFGRDSAQLDRAQLDSAQLDSAQLDSAQLDSAQLDSDAHPAGEHVHATADAFTTWTIESDTPTTRPRIQKMMDELPGSVVRAKGFVWLEGSDQQPAVLQRVGRRWTLRKLGTWPESPQTRIVVIAVAGRP